VYPERDKQYFVSNFNRVPTDLETRGILLVVREQWNIACIISWCNWWSSFFKVQKRDELFWIIWIRFLLFSYF